MLSLRNFIDDQQGQLLPIAAFVLAIFLLGFAAIAIDTGFIFQTRRVAQVAADAAAVAAAEEYVSGNPSNAQSAAEAVARLNRFDTRSTTQPATVTLSSPQAGNFTGNAYVRATVSKPVQTFFMRMFQAGTMTVGASAIAGGGQPSPTCMCLEGSSGTDLSVTNGSSISAPACGITVDSATNNAIQVSGASSLGALTINSIASNWDTPANVNGGGAVTSSTKINQGITTKCKPSIAAPALPTGITCYANPVAGYGSSTGYTGNYTLPFTGEVATNGMLCLQSVDMSRAHSVTFTPGIIYFIQGDLTTGGAAVSGFGVEIYVGGNISITNGSVINLSAPNDANGVPGVLFYVAGATVTVNGGSGSKLSGIVYAPGAAVDLSNGTGTTTNTDFVANTLTVKGGSALTSYASASLGTVNLSVAKLVQ